MLTTGKVRYTLPALKNLNCPTNQAPLSSIFRANALAMSVYPDARDTKIKNLKIMNGTFRLSHGPDHVSFLTRDCFLLPQENKKNEKKLQVVSLYKVV